MNEVVGPGAVASCKNLYFSLTNTYRDDDVDPTSQGVTNAVDTLNASGSNGAKEVTNGATNAGNFIITKCGMIYKVSEPPAESAAITVIGGRDTFAHEKQPRPYTFYITQRQKITLYQILRELAQKNNKAELHSDNPVLDQILTNTFANYCG